MFLELHGLSHSFGKGQKLFLPITESFESGETVALLGPSGSGKSTLLAIIAGVLDPTHGQVKRRESIRSCWVPQNPHGVSKRTVVDHLTVVYLARGLKRTEAQTRAFELLDRFGLGQASHQPYSTLSGGQAQRLMIARGFAAQPDILLIDEPTAQLDRHTAKDVDHSISRLADSGMLVFVATHSDATSQSCQRQIKLQLDDGPQNEAS